MACDSALMMIVSKYGFSDLIENSYKFASDVRLDPSKMAQRIVTGVGFLCAGVIYFQRGGYKGAYHCCRYMDVSGTGMVIGAGMYLIGISATIFDYRAAVDFTH